MDEREMLLRYLGYQRGCVLDVLDGLGEDALHAPLKPMGWTPIGLVAHLCGAERYWFQWVLTATPPAPPPWPAPAGDDERGEDAPFAVEQPSAAVFDFYREQVRISDANLAGADFDAVPPGEPLPSHHELASSVRSTVLHMVEETARHVGHLDIARELIDGRTGLAPR